MSNVPIAKFLLEKNAQLGKYLMPLSLIGLGGLGTYGMYQALKPEPTMFERLSNLVPPSVKDMGADVLSGLGQAGAFTNMLPQYLPPQMGYNQGMLGFHGEYPGAGMPSMDQMSSLPLPQSMIPPSPSITSQYPELSQDIGQTQNELMSFSPYML